MEYRVVIRGKLPNLNDYLSAERIRIKTPRGITTKGNILKQNTQKDILEYLNYQLKGKKIHEPVSIHYHFFEPNKKRDLDNVASFCMKVFQDALTKGGYLSNDGWNNIKGFTCDFDVDTTNPRIEISIKER